MFEMVRLFQNSKPLVQFHLAAYEVCLTIVAKIEAPEIRSEKNEFQLNTVNGSDER